MVDVTVVTLLIVVVVIFTVILSVAFTSSHYEKRAMRSGDGRMVPDRERGGMKFAFNGEKDGQDNG